MRAPRERFGLSVPARSAGRMETHMRRKLSAPDWRLPRRMTLKQWSVAVSRPPRLCGAGAMYAVGILARLRQWALPPRAPLPRAVSVLLGAQAGDGAGRVGESRSRLPAVARALVARLAQRLGRRLVVLMSELLAYPRRCEQSSISSLRASAKQSRAAGAEAGLLRR